MFPLLRPIFSIQPGEPARARSVPDTWVTFHSEDIGNTFGPKGLAKGFEPAGLVAETSLLASGPLLELARTGQVVGNVAGYIADLDRLDQIIRPTDIACAHVIERAAHLMKDLTAVLQGFTGGCDIRP